MSNLRPHSIITRRQTVIGSASLALAAGVPVPAAAYFVPWSAHFSAAVAAGWLVEALKNWGLVPETRVATNAAVQQDHSQKLTGLEQQGYSTRSLYSGDSAAGDFQVSEARLADDYLALGTTQHGTTCTVQLDKADTVNLGVVATALRQKGVDSRTIQAAGHPIHPRADNYFVGNERFSPQYLTPGHGTIAWKTNVNNPRPNSITAVRTGGLNNNIHVAQLENGRWVYDVRPPVDLRYA